ncbi:MAG: IS110 family transposase [bacterium]
MTEKYYLGIDLHKKFAYWHLTDSLGETLWQGKVPTTGEATQKQLEKFKIDLGKTVSAIESVESYGWYADILESFGVGEVKLANPWKLRLVAENPLKNDKVDAQIIAQYLKSGTLPESYLAPKETRDLRELVRTRAFLVRMRTSAKIRIRSAMAKNGLIGAFKAVDSIKASEWFAKQDFSPNYKQEIGTLLNFIIHINSDVEQYEREMKKQSKNYPEAKILKSIPGIADVRALTIIAEVGNFSRFTHPDKLASFADLVPRSYSSGGKERLGRITKRGSSVLRATMVSAAQQANPSTSTFLPRSSEMFGKSCTSAKTITTFAG